jgi:hypothetical protein
MSPREVIARAVWGTDIGAGAPADVVSCGVPNWQLCLPDADAILAALDAAGKVVVDRSVLIEARDEITAYVKREYAGCEGYLSMERRMQRDLELARELDRLAAAKEAGDG